MIKTSIFLTRRADLTHAEFVEHWTQRHSPMLADLPSDVQISRYVQLQPVEDSIPGVRTADEVDGVAELWTESVDDAARWFTSETYLTAIAADEENFLDRTKTRFLHATEEVVFA